MASRFRAHSPGALRATATGGEMGFGRGVDEGLHFCAQGIQGCSAPRAATSERLGLDFQHAAAPVLLCSGLTSTKLAFLLLFLLHPFFFSSSVSISLFFLSLLFSVSSSFSLFFLSSGKDCAKRVWGGVCEAREALRAGGVFSLQQCTWGGPLLLCPTELLKEAQVGAWLGAGSLCRGGGFWSPLAWLAGHAGWGSETRKYGNGVWCVG